MPTTHQPSLATFGTRDFLDDGPRRITDMWDYLAANQRADRIQAELAAERAEAERVAALPKVSAEQQARIDARMAERRAERRSAR
jgi:hypothetical protein